MKKRKPLTKEKIVYGSIGAGIVAVGGALIGVGSMHDEYKSDVLLDFTKTAVPGEKNRTQKIVNFDKNNRIMIGDAIMERSKGLVNWGENEKVVKIETNPIESALDDNPNILIYRFANITKAEVTPPNPAPAPAPATTTPATGATTTPATGAATTPATGATTTPATGAATTPATGAATTPATGAATTPATGTTTGTPAASFDHTKNELGEWETPNLPVTDPNYQGVVPKDYDPTDYVDPGQDGDRYKDAIIKDGYDDYQMDGQILHTVRFDSETGKILDIRDGSGNKVNPTKVAALKSTLSTKEFEFLDDKRHKYNRYVSMDEAVNEMQRVVDELGACRGATQSKAIFEAIADSKIDNTNFNSIGISAIIDIPDYIKLSAVKKVGDTIKYTLSFDQVAFPELKQKITFDHKFVLYKQPGGAIQLLEEIVDFFNKQLAAPRHFSSVVHEEIIAASSGLIDTTNTDSDPKTKPLSELLKLFGMKRDDLDIDGWLKKLPDLDFEYKILQPLDHDGKLMVEIIPKYKRYYPTHKVSPIEVDVTGISKTVVNNEQSRLGKISSSSLSFTHHGTSLSPRTNVVLTPAIVRDMRISSYKFDFNRFTYHISSDGATKDGSVGFKITPTYKGVNPDSTPHTHHIKVVGIDLAKEQAKLKAEQTRIENIFKTQTFNVNDVKFSAEADKPITAAYLKAHGLSASLIHSGFTYTISHSRVDKDGTFTTKITAHLKSNVSGNVGKDVSPISSPKDINPHVKGIDAVKNLQKEQQRANAITPKPSVVYKTKISTMKDTPLTPALAAEFGISGFKLDPNYQYFISVPKEATADGPVEFSISVKKGNVLAQAKPSTHRAQITGISDMKKLSDLQDKINKSPTFDAQVNAVSIAQINGPATKAQLQELGLVKQFGLDTTKYQYTLKHGKIQADGTVPITLGVELKAGGHTYQPASPATPINVNIKGLDDTKELYNEQARLNTLAKQPHSAWVDASEVKAIPANTKLTQAIIDKFKLGIVMDPKFEYNIEGTALTANGEATLQITVSESGVNNLNTDPHEWKVKVTGLTEAKALMAEQKRVSGLASGTFAGKCDKDKLAAAKDLPLTPTLVTQYGLGSMKFDFAKYNYLISHGELTKNGDLDTTIVVKAKTPNPLTQTEPASKVTIKITGLDKAKLIKEITKEQEKVNAIPPQTVSVNELTAFDKPVVLDAATIAKLGITGLTLQSKYVYTLTAPSTVTKDGTYKVKITVTDVANPTAIKSTKAPTDIDVNVTGVTAVKELKDEQEKINKAKPTGAAYSKSTLPEVSAYTSLTQTIADELGLGITLDTSKFVYEYKTSGDLTENGDFKVTIKVTDAKNAATKQITSPTEITTPMTGISEKRREEELAAEQKVVNTEAKSSTSTHKTLTLTTTSKAAASKAPMTTDMFTALGITKKPGFEYAYTMPEVKADGTYKVKVFVTMPTGKNITGPAKVTVTPEEFTIDVDGIDNQKIIAERNRMKGVSGTVALTESDLINTKVTDTGDVAFDTVTSGVLDNSIISKFNLKVGGKPLQLDGDFKYTYTIKETKANGDMVIEISVDGESKLTSKPLPKGAATTTTKIATTGIDVIKERKELEKEQQRINGLTGLSTYINEMAVKPISHVPLTGASSVLGKLFGQTLDSSKTVTGQAAAITTDKAAALAALGLKTKYTYTLTTTGISADGDLIVHIQVSGDDSTGKALPNTVKVGDVKVAVTGIDDEIARLAAIMGQKALDNTPVIDTPITGVVTRTTDSSSPLDDAAITKLGLDKIVLKAGGKTIPAIKSFIDQYTKTHSGAVFTFETMNLGMTTPPTTGIPKLTAAEEAETDQTKFAAAHKRLAGEWKTWLASHPTTATPLTANGELLLHIQMKLGTVEENWYSLLDVTGIDNEIARRALGAEQDKMNKVTSLGARFDTLTSLKVVTTPAPLTDAIIKQYGLKDDKGAPLTLDPKYKYTYVTENHRVAGGLDPKIIGNEKVGDDFQGNGHFGIKIIVTDGAIEATSADGKTKVDPVMVSNDKDPDQFMIKGLDEKKALIDQDKMQEEVNKLPSLKMEVDHATNMDDVLKTILGISDVSKISSLELTGDQLIALGLAHRSSDPTTGTSGFDLDGQVTGSISTPPTMTSVYTYVLDNPPKNITKDGTYNLKIKVMLKVGGKLEAPKTTNAIDLSIAITGLDKVNALKKQQEDINAAATAATTLTSKIDELDLNEVPTFTVLTETIARRFGIEAALTAAGIDLTDSNYVYEYTLTNKANPGNKIEANGDVEISIKVSNPDKATDPTAKEQLEKTQTPFVVSLTGITERRKLKELQEDINAAATTSDTTPIDVAVTVDHIDAETDTTLTDAVIKRFHLVDGKGNALKMDPGFAYTYSYPAITSDGALKITVKVSKTGVTGIGTYHAYNTNITGMDSLKDLQKEQEKVNKLTPSTARINASTIAGATDAPLTDAIIKQYGLTLTMDSKFDYTYTVGSANANGDVDFTIKVTNKGTTTSPYPATPITISLTGIDEVKTLNAEQTRVNGIKADPLVWTKDKIDEVTKGTALTQTLADEIFGTGVLTLDAAFDYTYEHVELTADGQLDVTVSVKDKKDPTTTNEITPSSIAVTVTGIDAIKELTAAQTYVNGLAKPTDAAHLKASIHELELKAETDTPLTDAIIKKYGLGIVMDSKFDYKYTIPTGLKKDGEFTVVVTLTDKNDPTMANGALPAQSFHIDATGIDSANVVQTDIDSLKDTYAITAPQTGTVTDGYNTNEYTAGDVLTQDQIQRLTKDSLTKGTDIDNDFVIDQITGATRTYKVKSKTADQLVITITDTDGDYTATRDITLTGFIAGTTANDLDYPTEEIKTDITKLSTTTHTTPVVLVVSAHTDEELTQKWIDFFDLHQLVMDSRFDYTFSNAECKGGNMDVTIKVVRKGETDHSLDVSEKVQVDVPTPPVLDAVFKTTTFAHAAIANTGTITGMPQEITDYIGKVLDKFGGFDATFSMPSIDYNENKVVDLVITLTSIDDSSVTNTIHIYIATGDPTKFTAPVKKLITNGDLVATKNVPTMTGVPVKDPDAIIADVVTKLKAAATSGVDAVINAESFAKIATGTDLTDGIMGELNIGVQTGAAIGLPGGEFTASTDKELTADGDVILTITPKGESPIAITVHVTGIDDFKKLKADLDGLTDTYQVKPRAGQTWTTKDYLAYDTVLTDDQLQRLTTINEWTQAALDASGSDAIKSPENGIVRHITITKVTDADMTIVITDTLGDATYSREVTLSGFTTPTSSSSSSNDLEYLHEQIKKELDALHATPIKIDNYNGDGIPMVTDQLVTDDVLKFFGITLDRKPGAVYTYSTDKSLSADGTLTLTIKANFPTKTVETTIDVDMKFDTPDPLSVLVTGLTTGTIQGSALTPEQLKAFQDSLPSNLDPTDYEFRDIVITDNGGVLSFTAKLVNLNNGIVKNIVGNVMGIPTTTDVTVPNAAQKIIAFKDGNAVDFNTFNAFLPAANKLKALPAGFSYNIVVSVDASGDTIATIKIMKGTTEFSKGEYHFVGLKGTDDGDKHQFYYNTGRADRVGQLPTPLGMPDFDSSDKLTKDWWIFKAGDSKTYIRNSCGAITYASDRWPHTEYTQLFIVPLDRAVDNNGAGNGLHNLDTNFRWDLYQHKLFERGNAGHSMNTNIQIKSWNANPPGYLAFHQWVNTEAGGFRLGLSNWDVNQGFDLSSIVSNPKDHCLFSIVTLDDAGELVVHTDTDLSGPSAVKDFPFTDEERGGIWALFWLFNNQGKFPDDELHHVTFDKVIDGIKDGSIKSLAGKTPTYFGTAGSTTVTPSTSTPKAYETYPEETTVEDLGKSTTADPTIVILDHNKADLASAVTDQPAPDWLLNAFHIKLKHGETLTYSAPAIIGNGPADFTFKLKDAAGTKTYVAHADVQGFNEYNDGVKAFASLETKMNALGAGSIDKVTSAIDQVGHQPLTQAILDSYGIGLTLADGTAKGVTFTYTTDKPLLDDGTMKLTIEAKLPNDFTITKTVDVTATFDSAAPAPSPAPPPDPADEAYDEASDEAYDEAFDYPQEMIGTSKFTQPIRKLYLKINN